MAWTLLMLNAQAVLIAQRTMFVTQMGLNVSQKTQQMALRKASVILQMATKTVVTTNATRAHAQSSLAKERTPVTLKTQMLAGTENASKGTVSEWKTTVTAKMNVTSEITMPVDTETVLLVLVSE